VPNSPQLMVKVTVFLFSPVKNALAVAGMIAVATTARAKTTVAAGDVAHDGPPRVGSMLSLAPRRYKPSTHGHGCVLR
jgi:2-methylaconitate cis-trans-isomerase PrpF